MFNPTTHPIDSGTVQDELTAPKTAPPASSLPEAPPDSPRKPLVSLRLQVLGVGAGLAVALILFAVFESSNGVPKADPANGQISTNLSPPEAPADSLGIRFDQFRDLWNALDQPPSISRPLSRTLEAGPYDSFSHRFDASAVVAGAYDPANDYIVALMVRSSIEHPDISNMYLHLCYILHPFSAECIDNYSEIGLNGQTREELSEQGHGVSWYYQGNRWQLTVAGNIETIRVTAPGSE